MKIEPGPLLSTVNNPDDLKKLKPEQLYDFCQELRDFIISTVSVNGGHFGASLGVVEITTALHYVFNTPYDQLVWDVGHQAYGHKILTERREVFHTNRKFGGISGLFGIVRARGKQCTSSRRVLGISFNKETA